MKETLWLHKSIANGPFPVTHLWCSSSSALMKDLEHAEPASLPSTTDYQTFVIPSLPSENLPAERIEEDPEDNHSNVADSDNELRQYWAENPRPMTLLPIGTIIETIDNPDSTMELQRPMHIWHEFVKLETEPNPDDVCPHFITIQG